MKKLCVTILVFVSACILCYIAVYSVNQNLNVLTWDEKYKALCISVVINITVFLSIWIFEQQWFLSYPNLKSFPVKNDLDVFIDTIREEEYINGNIYKTPTS